MNSLKVKNHLGETLKTFFLFFFSLTAFAGTPTAVRWTGADDKNAEIHHVLDVIKQKTKVALSTNRLMLLESRPLATSHFSMYVQTQAGLPVRGRTLRLWTSPKTGELIQAEAQVEELSPIQTWALSTRENLTSEKTMDLVRKEVYRLREDLSIRSTKWQDEWHQENLVRTVTVKGKRGKHVIVISIPGQSVVSSSFEEFPQADTQEFSLPVRVYPIYEEVEPEADSRKPQTTLPRIESQLRYLNRLVTRVTEDPYRSLRTQRYEDGKYDPLKGLTLEGRKDGFWSPFYLKEQARSLLSQLPLSENSFANGVILQGRYATVSLEPSVKEKFPSLSFTPQLSGQYFPLWKSMADKPDHEEMIPMNSLLGKPLTSPEEAFHRPARRLPDHDTASYINDGFDELQVYWAITQLFDSLHAMGFTDADLSTRPFNAFLYNPEISMRDNAFYTDDTINFTTYSGKNQNFARDNTTVWHELGHGVMDRLMGDYLSFNDTGGLSEGMADFVAQLVINDITGGLAFEGKEKMRIFNSTGFYLTNEVHDDGEAYGGAMNDLLRSAMSLYGREGLLKVTDLTLEAMRLTRNHPNLTALDWFEHMLFADELGSSVRRRGELKDLVLQSLNGRNFVFGNTQPALFTLKNGEDEVTSKSLGSRGNPIKLQLKESEKANYTLKVSVKNGANYSFKFPVTVKVDFKTGALQGAVHWEGEEASPLIYTLQSENDTVSIPVGTSGKCDAINWPGNACQDYAYVQIWNQGETVKPQAKKRFYLRVYPQPN